MRLGAEVTVPADSFLLASVLPETPVTVQPVHLVPAARATIPYLWVWGTRDALAAFETRAAEADEVADIQRLVERGEVDGDGPASAGADDADSNGTEDRVDDMTDPDEPDESSGPDDPAGPTGSTEAAGSKRPTDSTGPTRSTSPDRSTNSTGSTEATDSTQTTGSTDPTGSTNPAGSRGPTDDEVTRLYEVTWAEGSADLLAVLAETDVHLARAVGRGERWHLELLAAEQAALSAFGEGCAERSIPVTLERLTTPRPPTEGPTEVLTQPQREALATALEMGYFEVPRGATLEELGDRLGVSRQAASSLLRRGTEALLEASFTTGRPGDHRRDDEK